MFVYLSGCQSTWFIPIPSFLHILPPSHYILKKASLLFWQSPLHSPFTGSAVDAKVYFRPSQLSVFVTSNTCLTERCLRPIPPLNIPLHAAPCILPLSICLSSFRYEPLRVSHTDRRTNSPGGQSPDRQLPFSIWAICSLALGGCQGFRLILELYQHSCHYNTLPWNSAVALWQIIVC